jgi:hypothetical protein
VAAQRRGKCSFQPQFVKVACYTHP